MRILHLAIQVLQTPPHQIIRPYFNSPDLFSLDDVGDLERWKYCFGWHFVKQSLYGHCRFFCVLRGGLAYPATTPVTSEHGTKAELTLQFLQSKPLSFKSCTRKVAPSNVGKLTVRMLWKRENPQAGPNVFVPQIFVLTSD